MLQLTKILAAPDNALECMVHFNGETLRLIVSYGSHKVGFCHVMVTAYRGREFAGQWAVRGSDRRESLSRFISCGGLFPLVD